MFTGFNLTVGRRRHQYN